MLSFCYLITNPANGKSFSIGCTDSGGSACTAGRGLILQEYPTFTLDVRNDFKDKSGQHGSVDFFSFYGSRSITFSGLILADTHADLMILENRVREVLTLPSQPVEGTNDGFLEITWTDDFGIEWKIDAKINQDVVFSRKLGVQMQSSFFVGLRASNPYILSTTLNEQPELRGWSQGRMALPTFLENNINIDWNRLINVYQAGTSDSPGTYRVYGPAENPRIIKLEESFSNETEVADFDSTEAWVGGTSDTSYYQSGEEARKLTSTAGVQDTMTLPVTLDLSSPEFVTFYFYVDEADNIAYGDYTEGENYLKFKTTVGVDEFVLEFSVGNGTIRTGWNYFQALKDEFKQIGTPDWSSIVELEFSIKAKPSMNLNITFDELRVRDITHDSKTLELSFTLSGNQYVEFNTLEGTILDQDGNDMSSYLTTDSEWFYIRPRQNLIYMESDEANPLDTFALPYTLNDPVVEDNLVAYWPMEETSGSTVADIVGTADGTATNATILEGSGVGGSNCRNFNGVSGNILIPDTLTTRNTFTGGGSAVVAVNPNSDGEGSAGNILSKVNGYKIYLADESAGYARLYFQKYFSGTDGVWKTTSLVIPINEETVVEICYDDGATTNDPVIYVKGISVPVTQVATPTGTSSSDTGYSLYIGGNSTDTRTFDGSIDEVRLYDKIHTSAEAYEIGNNPEQNKYKNQITVYWNDAQL